jgi:hypothetical protein
MDSDNLEQTLEEMAEGQRSALLKVARRLVPAMTPEDLLQPNDYPELENHPEFRYEEGVLAGILSALSALRFLNSP